MNISFLNKAALGVLLVATCVVAFWRYEVTVVQPRQNSLLMSFQDDLRDRDKLKEILQHFKDIRAGVERIAVDGKLNDSVVGSLQSSLASISSSDARLLAGTKGSIREFGVDLNEFLKITNQLSLYEAKVKEFTERFAVYFQVFENDVTTWKEAAAGAIMAGTDVSDTIPTAAMIQKVATLEKIIPELGAFEQKLQNLETGLDQWTKDINAASALEDKQTIFGQRQYLLKGFSDLFATFNGYVFKTLDRENTNVHQIADQINGSINAVEQPLQEKFGGLNNAIETQVIQAKFKEHEYQNLKRIGVGTVFVLLIGLFFGMVIYSFRFEKGMALFSRQTFKASTDSRELASSLNDHAGLMVRNFDLTTTLKEGLQEASDGFTDRQLNLQNIDQLVRDTDLLVNESRENFLSIKEEFYNTEKVSQEIVALTGALNGVAQQMTVIADRAALNVTKKSKQADGKQDTIDELKYLSSRIRHAVGSTHDALEARKDKITEAKTKFDLIEQNMDQMTENTREALKQIALARLDHSQEESRINEILQSAKTKSLQIADEINGLNRQVRDFSVLSKHLDALHDLAIKASALNAQSLLVATKDPDIVPVLESSSRRMNDFIQEYFTKVFESDTLRSSVKTETANGDLSEKSSQKPASRITEAINNT